MRELALFAGAGGGILAGVLLGWQTVCAVELDSYARSVLVARQNDGSLRPFPIWDDVRTFDGAPWRGRVDVISGGFPCQDISAAGAGRGIDGSRSGLWSEMARIVREVRPRFVFVENSPTLTVRGLGVVLGDLAALGYDAAWDVFGARHVGAPHRRDRIWVLATDAHRAALRDNEQRQAPGRDEIQNRRKAEPGDDGPARIVAHSVRIGLENHHKARTKATTAGICRNGRRWWAADPANGETQPYVGRVVDGVADGLDRCSRLRSIGNGQVPQVAAVAWSKLVATFFEKDA